MSTDIGYMLSVCAGIFIGIQIFNWLCDKRREAQQEENEQINQQLKRQMERICWEQRYKSELEELNKAYNCLKQKIPDQRIFEAALRAAEKKKLETEHKIPMTDFADCAIKFTTSEPKDGVLLEYHGKLLTYKSGIGWTILDTNSEKFSKKEIIKDLWYGTGGK